MDGGPGRDYFLLKGSPVAPIDGGRGVDLIVPPPSGDPIVIDLAAGTLESDSMTASFSSIEDANGTEGADVMTGSDAPNELYGNAGDDILTGAGGDDILRGSRGDDNADGGDGTDACRAETETNCETPPPPLVSDARWEQFERLGASVAALRSAIRRVLA